MSWIISESLSRFKVFTRRFHRDRSGEASVGNVMWIAVGVLILVAVVSLVVVFWDSIVGKVNQIDPGVDGGKVKKVN